MKFLKIEYKNYRCFMDLSMEFKYNKDKNITLIVAPNGGGKTEMLFSFWWVLYDFDFRTLKGKEDTPYALNSALYLDLQNSSTDKTYECSVLLKFENNERVYTLKRTESYVKSKGIKIIKSIEFSSINQNGSFELPIRDMDLVNRKLSRIIPKNILHGIIFDGERMKELSSIDEDSKKAVEGIISDITNEELFELVKAEYNDLDSKNNSLLKKEARKIGKMNLEKIVETIENYTKELNIAEPAIIAKREDLSIVKSNLERISKELKKYEESKNYEIKRVQLKAELITLNKKLVEFTDDFCQTLRDGYFLICEGFFEEITNSLEQHDVPAGLTVEAVLNILKRDECVCGRQIGEKERQKMKTLLESLPPDNINSTIAEMIRQSKLYTIDQKKKLKKSHDNLTEIENKIKKNKEDTAFTSSQISADGPKIVKDLEVKRDGFIIEEDNLNRKINELDIKIKFWKSEIAQLTVKKNSINNVSSTIDYLNKKSVYIKKCKDALIKIDEYNKEYSLKNINSKINIAYNILSEDYLRGRKLYIVQFDQSKKYRLVSYYQNNFDNLYKSYLENNTLAAFKMEGLTDEQINEKIILKILESNSTGQSKIITLAFAKAILDYSTEARDADSTEITKDYPFMIDSPFTELSDGNLEMSAENIHNFSSQIILMISKDSLEGVNDQLMPFVNNVQRLEKKDNESYSFLKDGE